jgi:hypothetical protein
LGCQHGAAFLLALLVQLECPPGTPVQTPVPEGTPIAPDPSTMAGSVSLRLGGVVPPVIQGMLPILEGWWQARLQNVPLMNLMRLVPKTSGANSYALGIPGYDYSSIPVFPKRFPPADVGEYLDCLLFKFSRDSIALRCGGDGSERITSSIGN